MYFLDQGVGIFHKSRFTSFPPSFPLSVLFGASGYSGWPQWWSPAVTACLAAGGPLAAFSAGSPHPRGWCWWCQGQSLQSSHPWCWCYTDVISMFARCRAVILARFRWRLSAVPRAALIYTQSPGQHGSLGHRRRSGRQRVGAVKMINFWGTTDHCGDHCLFR